MSMTRRQRVHETDRRDVEPHRLAEQRHEHLPRRAHRLQNERAAAGGREHAALGAQHLQRAGEACVRILVRRHRAREREHGRTGDDGARDSDRERHGVTRDTGQHAARERADQRAAALEPRHRGDRAAELGRRADVREIGLSTQHPGRVARTERERRETDQPNLRREREQHQPAEDQREPAQQYRLVAEPGHEHAGGHVEQQHADAAQPDHERGQRRARADVEHVQRQQDRERLVAHGHQQRWHIDRQQQPVVRGWELQGLTAVIGDGLPLRSKSPFSVPSAASSTT